MDPGTVLGAVGLTLQLIKVIKNGIHWMQSAYEVVQHGDKTLRSISLECRIYGESIKTIGRWLKKNQRNTSMKRQMKTTHNAITLIECSLVNIVNDLKKVQSGSRKASSKQKTMSKEATNIKVFQQFMAVQTKRLWFQETMRLHLVELRAHAATLHLTLSVIELTEHQVEHNTTVPSESQVTSEALQRRTGQLERKLLLRKFIKKALEIKRIEIAKETARAEAEGVLIPFATAQSQGPEQELPKKLTFYDVVQLACQNAAVEKARKPIEDLIDLSDEPQAPLEIASLEGTRFSDDLLDLNDSTAISLDAPSILPLEVSQAFEEEVIELPIDKQTEAVELGAVVPQELAGSLLPVMAESQRPTTFEYDISGNARNEVIDKAIQHRRKSEEMLDLEPNEHQTQLFDLPPSASNPPKAVESNALQSPHNIANLEIVRKDSQPSSDYSMALINLDDDAESFYGESRPSSSIAPSVFSQTSSFSSTASSMTGISKEDIMARTLQSQNRARSSPSSFSRQFAGNSTVANARSPIISDTIYESGNEFHGPASAKSTSVMDLSLTMSPVQAKVSAANEPSHTDQAVMSHIDEPDQRGFPWIVSAARDGDEQMLQKLLFENANIKAQHIETQRQAIGEAALNGHHNIVEILIEHGAPLDDADFEGSTALHHACEKGRLEVAKLLLAAGASLDIAGPKRQTALHLAMKFPHQSVVMLLVQNKANVNARDSSFETPLHIGARKGNFAMCSHLLEEGAHVDSREAQGKTPLQFACEEGHHGLVQMMLEKSKLSPSSMTFLSAFFGAVEASQVRIAETFFTSGLELPQLRKDSFKPITLAAKSGSLAMVELMIQKDCEPDSKDENGWNALHFASYYGHYQVIERLIASGVTTSAITLRKQTPLLFAVKGGHFAVTERLLRGNSDNSFVRAEDELGEQPVHHAARIGSLEILNLLISNDAKLDVTNAFGWQPLHIATAYGHVNLVKRILQQGVNIEESTSLSLLKRSQTHKLVEDGYWAEARWPYPGSRPLHLACEYGRFDIAKHLIFTGAKLMPACNEGWQPLHHATFIGSSELVEMLLEGGAYPHAATNEGKTPSALGFCDGGDPIPEDVKVHIRTKLGEAMDRVRKQKNFKVALKKSSTVEEKNNLVRTVTFSMDVVSKSRLQNPMTTARISDPHLSPSYSVSTMRRPTLPHLPFTAPLPSFNRPSLSVSTRASTSQLPESKIKKEVADVKTSTPPTAFSDTFTTSPASSASALVPTSSTTTALTVDEPDEPIPKLKSRSATMNFSKLKPSSGSVSGIGSTVTGSLDAVGKFVPPFGGITRQTSEFTKSTLDMGKQGLDFGKQGMEKSKQKLELGRQGYQKATKKMFSRKGKEKDKNKQDVSGDGGDNSKQGTAKEQPGAVAGGADEEDNEDARSDFSVDEFAEYGNKNMQI